jgi:hypothetical protein
MTQEIFDLRFVQGLLAVGATVFSIVVLQFAMLVG